MKKINNLQENIFTEIGKIILMGLFKANLNKINMKLNSDQLKQSIQKQQAYQKTYQQAVDYICKRWPDSKECKSWSINKKSPNQG